MFFAVPSVYSRPKTYATMTEHMMSPPMPPISTTKVRKLGQSAGCPPKANLAFWPRRPRLAAMPGFFIIHMKKPPCQP